MRIYLIGFMGAGKSLLGSKLAAARGIPFIDLDGLIERETGLTVTSLFAKYGEEEFRRLEAASLRRTREHDRAVVATGGGAPCFDGNMDWMNNNGLTIYLKMPVEVLISRLKEGRSHRPLLAGLDDDALQAYVANKLTERAPFYEKAHFAYTGTDDPGQITDELVRHLGRFL